MNTGMCPYEDCGGVLPFVCVADNEGVWYKDTCPACLRTVWRLLSRVEPVAYTDEGFREAFDVDETCNKVKKKEVSGVDSTGVLCDDETVDSVTNQQGENMSEEKKDVKVVKDKKDKAPRKHAGPMKAMIGHWSAESAEAGDAQVFTALAVVDSDEASIKAALEKLGLGKYKVITFRERDAEIREVKRTSVQIG